MNKKIFVLIPLVFLLLGCSKSRNEVVLVDNQGIFVTDKSARLPIQSLVSIKNDNFLNKTLDEAYLDIQPYLNSYLENEDYKINTFSLKDCYLLLNKKYKKPVTIQMIVGNKQINTVRDYEWKEGEEEVFLEMPPYENPTGVIINIFSTNDKNIIEEYESYFFVYQNKTN